MREHVVAAHREMIAATEPPNPGAMIALITRFVRLVGADWPTAQRKEFIDEIALNLADLPGDLVLDALDRARTHVALGRMLLPWVAEDVARRRVTVERYREIIGLLADAIA